MKHLTLLTLLFSLVTPIEDTAAQGVLIAPHAIFMDHRTRSTAVTLYNPGDSPAEISISTFYGYPVTDSAGVFELYAPESASDREPSAANWIQAYPRRLVLQPRQRQTIRLLARPPAGLADGEYWTRLVVSAKGGAVPVTGVADTSVQIGLELEIRSVLPLQYRKGALTTGVRIAALTTARDGDSLAIRPQFTREGSAAWLGTVRGALQDADGRTVGSVTSPLAVYREMTPRLAIAVGSLPPGLYRLVLEAVTERTDIAPEFVLPARPATRTIDVRLP